LKNYGGGQYDAIRYIDSKYQNCVGLWDWTIPIYHRGQWLASQI